MLVVAVRGRLLPVDARVVSMKTNSPQKLVQGVLKLLVKRHRVGWICLVNMVSDATEQLQELSIPEAFIGISVSCLVWYLHLTAGVDYLGLRRRNFEDPAEDIADHCL